MTLVNAADLLIAQIETAIRINGRLRRAAFDEGDMTKWKHLNRFSRRLNVLHSKAIVARAEVTDLCIHGCVAVTSKESD
ncbi:MAG: hypothetical protein II968_07825 [Selenomonadaceae bacterium]|nr:hypothetical protein [Selenomonadaceae bacterium]